MPDSKEVVEGAEAQGGERTMGDRMREVERWRDCRSKRCLDGRFGVHLGESVSPGTLSEK